jgi:hypothetical protein
MIRDDKEEWIRNDMYIYLRMFQYNCASGRGEPTRIVLSFGFSGGARSG